jgi:histone demethylase JARID1
MSEELDLSSVPMPIPGRAQPVRQSPRLFGLEEAPSFYPTAKQFSDPMAYISSISSEAEKYGICKIIPPDEWKMPFVTNTKVRVRFFRPTSYQTELFI